MQLLCPMNSTQDEKFANLVDADPRALLLRIYALAQSISVREQAAAEANPAVLAETRTIQLSAMALADRLGVDLTAIRVVHVQKRDFAV
ncbi:hypothetical protein [Pseudoxanthomonas sp. GM95]|uniref:hypothetical protein n=1 Tax=Pseudoxanthomonas sp. GM95 TaxID=1881043 RepID=UPI0011141200|nr:hypothetical protein [Pseudoxanthomonas sp. GM95]